MKNSKAVSVIVMALSGVMTMMACKKEKKTVVVPTVSFSKDLVPIFQASCASSNSCHLGAYNANDEINLDSSVAYLTIVNKGLVMTSNPPASLLYAEVSSGAMPRPPNAALTVTQVNLILYWIEQGAKNN